MFLLLLLPFDTVQEVGRIEYSHVYCEEGHLILDQLIFYEATPTGFEILAWRLWRHNPPTYNHTLKRWEVIWHDGDTMRVIRSYSYVETWKQYDPELRGRNTLPLPKRKGLYYGPYRTPMSKLPQSQDSIP
jgi:hypothetical protein